MVELQMLNRTAWCIDLELQYVLSYYYYHDNCSNQVKY